MSYPPQEIIDQMNEGRDFEWDIKERIEKKGWIITKLSCGCIFENKVDEFGYSNHFCDTHAPSHEYQTPIRQEEEK